MMDYLIIYICIYIYFYIVSPEDIEILREMWLPSFSGAGRGF